MFLCQNNNLFVFGSYKKTNKQKRFQDTIKEDDMRETSHFPLTTKLKVHLRTADFFFFPGLGIIVPYTVWPE